MSCVFSCWRPFEAKTKTLPGARCLFAQPIRACNATSSIKDVRNNVQGFVEMQHMNVPRGLASGGPRDGQRLTRRSRLPGQQNQPLFYRAACRINKRWVTGDHITKLRKHVHASCEVSLICQFADSREHKACAGCGISFCKQSPY